MLSAIAGMNSRVVPSNHPSCQSPYTDESFSHCNREISPLDRDTLVKRSHVSELPHFFWKHLAPSTSPDFPFLPSALFPRKTAAKVNHCMKKDRTKMFSRKEDEEQKSRGGLEGTRCPSLNVISSGIPVLHFPSSRRVVSVSDMDEDTEEVKVQEEYDAWNNTPQQDKSHSFQPFLLPPGRCCHTMDAYQNRYLIVFGGGSPSWNVGKDVWVYDLRKHQWSCHECNGESETNDFTDAKRSRREKDHNSTPYSGIRYEKGEERRGRWVGPKEIGRETPSIPTTSLPHFHHYPENFLPRALERNRIENTNVLLPSSALFPLFSPHSYSPCRSFIYSYSFSASSEASSREGRISSYPFPYLPQSSLLSSTKSLPNAKNVHPSSRIIHSSCIYKDFLIIYGGHGLGSVEAQETGEQIAADHEDITHPFSVSSPTSSVPVQEGHSRRSNSSSHQESSAVSHDILSHHSGQRRDSEVSVESTVSIRSTEWTRGRSPNLSVSSPFIPHAAECGLLDDMFVLDLQQWKWRHLGHVPAAPDGPGAREYHTAHIHQERMYVVMGFTEEEEDEEEEEEEEELQEVNDTDVAEEWVIAPAWLTPSTSEEQNERVMRRRRWVEERNNQTAHQAEENDEGLQTSPHQHTTDHLKASSFCLPSFTSSSSSSSSSSRSISSSPPLVWYMDLHAGTWHPAEPMPLPKSTFSAPPGSSFRVDSNNVVVHPSPPPPPTTMSTLLTPTVPRTTSPMVPHTPITSVYRNEKRLPMGVHNAANAKSNNEAPKKCLGGHTAAVEKDKIYIFGGTSSRKRWNVHQYSNQLYIFHLHTHQWERVRVKASQPSPPPRYGAALAVKDGVVYVFGGDRPEERLVLGDFWRIDTEAAEPEWEEMKVLPTTKTIRRGENEEKENEELSEDDREQEKDTLTPEEVRRRIEIPTERRRYPLFPVDGSTTADDGVQERHPFPFGMPSVSLCQPEEQQRADEEDEEAFAIMIKAKHKELLVPYSLHNLERPMPRTGAGYATVCGNLYIMGGESVTLARSRTVSSCASFPSHSSPHFSHSTFTTTASHEGLFEIGTDSMAGTVPSGGITCDAEGFPLPPPTSSLLPPFPRGLPSSIQHQFGTEVVYSNDLYMYPLGMSTSLIASTNSVPATLEKTRRNCRSPWAEGEKWVKDMKKEVYPRNDEEERKVPLSHEEVGGSRARQPEDGGDDALRSKPWLRTTSEANPHPSSSPSWVDWSLKMAKEQEKEKVLKVVPRTLLESAACWLSGSWTQMEQSAGPATMWSEIVHTCKTEPWSTLMTLTTCVPSRLLLEE